ncbi:ATP-dependent DNA helicase, partial [Brachionus plicatilis]
MTIHKSQGQSYTCVAVFIGDSLKRSLLYVALSRATKLSGLFLYGSLSIESARVQRLSKEQRQKELQLFEQNDPVRIEMNRLRSDANMKNNYSFLDFGFEANRTSDLTIMFQNIQSFNSNKENVKYDFGYKQADIIFLSECHNRKNFRQNEAKLLFDNYHLVYYSSGS